MSLFLQTLVLRDILSSEQEHRLEHMNLGPAKARRQAALKTAGRFAGAGGLKNAAVETCIRRYEQHKLF